MRVFDSELLKNAKHIHFVGIGGSGMFPLVQILHSFGYKITGSDVIDGYIVAYEREMGIDVKLRHDAKNVQGADLVVYTAALLDGNPEVLEAKRLGIRCEERAVLLGAVAALYRNPVCVSGTHGKTTTTAMITQILMMAGKDPAAVIGGKLPLINGYGKSGEGANIVVEACEFNDTFLHLRPHTSVILNIDEDHMEYFKTLDNLKNSFRRFALLTNHAVIANADDANTMDMLKTVDRHIITFGTKNFGDYQAKNIEMDRPAFYSFDVVYHGETLQRISLSIPGKHNIYNALAAYIAAKTTGCTAEQIKAGIEAFKGAGRRFEVLCIKDGITIADDYAHHPIEIDATLRAARLMGFKRVIAVFQPFTYSRTKNLMDDFAEALSLADEVVMTEIMAAREVNTNGVYTKQLADKIKGSVWYNTFDEVVEKLSEMKRDGDLIITMGCGDIYKAANKLVSKMN